jgi:DNA-binding CsgD family transcriptional regulator
MTSDERRLSLIRQVYAAAADESKWLEALECLADEFRGSFAGIMYRTKTYDGIRSARFARIDPALIDRLCTSCAPRNPWARATQSRYATGVVLGLHHLVPVARLRRTYLYDGILKPAGAWNGLGACVFRDGDDILSINVVRSDMRGPYEDWELRRLAFILPHVWCAIRVNQRLADLQRTNSALGDGLEELRHGVIVVDRRGHVAFANREARTILAQRDGVTIAADGLLAAAPACQRTLRALVDRAVRTGAGEGTGAGGAMTISRPSLKRPFLVLVAPLPLALDGDASSGMATVFISDPERPGGSVGNITRSMYGLTAAEARFADAFAASGSLTEAAESLCVSRETARWHVKHLYRKTGTQRQAALLKRLVDGPSRLGFVSR